MEKVEPTEERIIILGSGPAGLTAALYTARANLSPLLFTGPTFGGQLSMTSEIENYPGFEKGLGGMELMDQMEKQAKRFGARIVYEQVTGVDLKPDDLRVEVNGTVYRTRALIISTGSSPRQLNIPGEKAYWGKGVSYCATCDGFFFRDKRLVVVGGGDSAVEEATFLTKFATEVRLIHRRDRLRASPIMQKRVLDNPQVSFVWDAVVTEVLGNEEGVTAVRTQNVKNGAENILETDGVFVAIGHRPNTELFVGVLELDELGYIVTNRRQVTNIPGVFAAGDVQDHLFRQAVTAAGTGCAAAISAERYLAALEDRAYPGMA